MEYLKKKVNNAELDEYIITKETFAWKVTNKNIGANRTEVIFARDKAMPHYEDIRKLERKWKIEMEPISLHIYLFVVLAFIFLTLSLIFAKNGSSNPFSNPYVITFLSLGLLSFVLSALSFFLRVRKIQKNIVVFYEKRREYREKIEQLGSEQNG